MIVENLVPFTRWLTPAHRPRRFTTQMYLYFLPLLPDSSSSSPCFPVSHDQCQLAAVQNPTPDGGLEHTAAAFHPPVEWLSLASKGDIILFLPQFFLLTLISPFLSPLSLEPVGPSSTLPIATLRSQREALVGFIKSGDPPWGEKCISPRAIFRDEKREILVLDSPGPELQGTNRKGDSERIVIFNLEGDGRTSSIEVHMRESFSMEIGRKKL